MDFVLVFQLILALLCSVQSYNKETKGTWNCYEKCPVGHHKIGECDVEPGKFNCTKCERHTYMDEENLLEKCFRCSQCGKLEKQIRPCSFNSNAECDCKEGYYYSDSKPNPTYCKSCNCRHCEDADNPNYITKCLQGPSKNLKGSGYLSTASTTKPPSNASNPAVNTLTTATSHVFHLLLKVIGLICAVLLGLLLLTRIHAGRSNMCPCWRRNKGKELHIEEPKINETEKCSARGISPTTRIFNISEENPMMTVSHSPAIPQHPAHISPLLPKAEHGAARQDEQSDHWPAIVLYMIIKEVPLRRWKEFLRLLSVADQELERVEMEPGFGLGSMEKQYQMLRLWCQSSSASLSDVFSALHYMNLSGCAQLLQENLEKLQWRTDAK